MRRRWLPSDNPRRQRSLQRLQPQRPPLIHMPIAHQQGYIASEALGNAKALWASSFMTCQAANCRTNKITFGLDKLAGWAVEVTARNFSHLEALSQSKHDYALRKPGGRAVELAAHNLQKP